MQLEEEFKLFSAAERPGLLSTVMCILVSDRAALLSPSLIPIQRLCPNPSLCVHAARGAQGVLCSRAPGLAEHGDVHPCERPYSSLVAVLDPHTTAVR